MNQIKQLEKISRQLDPDAAQREQLTHQVIAYAEQHLAQISDAPAYFDRPDNGRALFDSPFTEKGIDIEQVLGLLRDNVDSTGINITSARHLGYVPGGGVYFSALGDYLAAVTNRYSGLFFANPGAAGMENMLLRWMADVMGYPDTAAGNLSSGGSIANLTAIVAARDAHGITGNAISRAVVYLTAHTHHSIDKALHVAGVGGTVKQKIPVDANNRMKSAALAEAISNDKKAGLIPWLVVASAGTTNTGSVDPLAEIGEIAAAYKLWYHVDGAYGAFFMLCPEGRAVLHGINSSDSITLDPHKTLFVPYGTGAVLVKNRNHLLSSFNITADYMRDAAISGDELSPNDVSPELTKHFRGLRLWLPLKLAGVAPFRAALSEKILLARYFHEKIQQIPGFEAGPSPDLSIATYRYVPKRGDADAFNHRLTQAVQKDGRVFISSTKVGGKLVLRAAIVGFRTHLDDIEETLRILKHTATRLAAEDN